MAMTAATTTKPSDHREEFGAVEGRGSLFLETDRSEER